MRIFKSKSKEKLPVGVFGRSLEELLSLQGEEIPLIVQQTVRWLEENGMEEEGIFRIPACQSELDSLKNKFNNDPKALVDLGNERPHTVAAALKLYCRELPEPVLLYRYYSTFLKVQQNTDADTRLTHLRLLIHKLPKQNRELLLYLCTFLKKVSEHADKNMMTSHNLATCWAPTLLRQDPSETSAENSLQEMMMQSESATGLIETIIDNIEFLSVHKLAPVQKIVRKRAVTLPLTGSSECICVV